MAISSYPPVQASKRILITLTSGTSWTVPAGVTAINATLIGGGGAGGGGFGSGSVYQQGTSGNGGQIISTNLSTTPGASIGYSIGAGGTGVIGSSSTTNIGGSGGNTTFTGATTASGGLGGQGYFPSSSPAGTSGLVSNNAGNGGSYSASKYSSDGGAGAIHIEYWV